MSSKVHLVCSSGGVRCFSYIGAVNRLYTNKVKIESISACSMGTVVGALIASGIDIKELEKKIIEFDFSLLKTRKPFGFLSLLRYPFASHYTPDFGKVMQNLLGEDMRLSELKIPFSALALDIRQKRFLVYSSETHPDMKISEVIKIATSIPFRYAPYKVETHLLVDAAVATESPVWMAVNRKGNYPIVVLKVTKELDISYKDNFITFLTNLISVSAESHDYFAATQIARNIDININCENIGFTNFNITQEQIENLILQGDSAAEQQLREFNYNFNNILKFNERQNIEEIENSVSEKYSTSDATKNAVSLAESMISGFKNEISNRNQIFVSYSHLDKKWLERLNTSLSAIERFTGIKAWSDTLILAGNVWNDEITNALSSTRIAVFLVTPNFLASKFIQENEMNYFLEVNKNQNIPILWIAISSSMYEITPLKNIQCANDPNIPLDTLTEPDQNNLITKICKKIIELMK
ncbi:MAG TPA: patatin-like phospholipase family protein [Cyclobacteriaceae bacterium]